MESGATRFAVKHTAGADLLEVTRHDAGESRLKQLMPAGGNDLVALLSDQLMRGGQHQIYLRVIDCIRPLI